MVCNGRSLIITIEILAHYQPYDQSGCLLEIPKKSTLMRKNLKLVAAATTALGLLFGMSCRKTPTESLSTPTQYQTAWTKSALFAGLRTEPFKFSVDAGVQSVGYGPQGTKLVFYPHSFKDASGNIISSGKIDIELTEMYTSGSMIGNNAVTTCNGQLLRSGGQVKIKATQNGKEVYANKYGIGFKQPDASSNPMELFYSNNNSLDSTTVWEEPDTMRVYWIAWCCKLLRILPQSPACHRVSLTIICLIPVLVSGGSIVTSLFPTLHRRPVFTFNHRIHLLTT